MINYTIIIPHFTESDTVQLENAVNSIPLREDIEVVIVDNSLKPIDKNLFGDRNDTIILFSENSRGAGGARNIGLNHAHGKWLLFLDSDDYFIDGSFDVFDKYVNSDYEIIYFKATSLFSDTRELADRHYPYCKMVDDYIIRKDDYSIRLNHCVPWCKMIYRNFVLKNGVLFDEVPASNDVMFALKIGLKANKISADNSVVYCITVTKGSITNTESLKNIESVFDVIIRKNAMLKQYGYKPNSSVMYQIYRASKFGLLPCLKLIFKALITNNLFVGWRRWPKTLKHGIHNYSRYIIRK